MYAPNNYDIHNVNQIIKEKKNKDNIKADFEEYDAVHATNKFNIIICPFARGFSRHV